MASALRQAVPLLSRRAYATESKASVLLFLEHRGGKLNPGVASALTAAQKLDTGDIHGIVTGSADEDLSAVIDQAKNLPLKRIIQHKSDALAHQMAEPTAPLIAELVKRQGYTHLVAAHTAVGKNVFPRVAALLDSAQVSDVIAIESADTFVRPFYAGNAIATVKSKDAVKIFTVRVSAFQAPESGSSGAEVEEAASGTEGSVQTEWISESLTKSERPELGAASRVVSGGRGVKNKENFDKVLTPLADALGAAIGASRAAVDSGYADNSLQVGQTGKVVAPELYVAVGISGAIQHLAGMKDSKTIVAINNDADAPIFQVADAGLVEDLFTAVPELAEKIQKAA